MKIQNNIIIPDGKETKTYKLSEQGVLAVVMLIQKIFMDVAQDRESRSIEECLEDYEFILDSEEKLWVSNPVSFSVDLPKDDDTEEVDYEEEETDKSEMN